MARSVKAPQHQSYRQTGNIKILPDAYFLMLYTAFPAYWGGRDGPGPHGGPVRIGHPRRLEMLYI